MAEKRFCLKQFQLYISILFLYLFTLREKFHTSKLFVCYGKNSYLAILGQESFNSWDVGLCILRWGTIPRINRELKHYKSIFQQILSELSRCFALLLCICGQIEEYQYPHYPIFAESFHQVTFPDIKVVLTHQRNTSSKMWPYGLQLLIEDDVFH